MSATVRLTSLAHGAGCGCKLPAQQLHRLLAGLPAHDDERVLVGFAGADDAAVTLIAENLALVQTVDFFTPIVDDPADFGAIAAANALSDVYAMGGRPLSALSVVGFPLQLLGVELLRSIVAGAIDVLNAAGVPLVGGHSIDDPEPKFGLSVAGTVDPTRILRNSGALPGDSLVLTKPLGTGVVATQAQHATVPPEMLAQAVSVMRSLNAPASEQALGAGAHAATDVTGFGLLGHVHGLARESGVAVVLCGDAVPVLSGVRELLADQLGISGGTRRNAEWAAAFTRFDQRVPVWQRWLLADATTSGGLLVAVAPDREAALQGTVIGQVIAGAPGTILVQ